MSDDEEVESMSNADIGALDKMVKKYSMDKIMKTINILKDRPLPEQTMTNFGPVRSVTKYNGLPIRDNVMDYANEILNQINDYENNVGPGEQMINYNATKEAARALMNAVDRDEEGMMREKDDSAMKKSALGMAMYGKKAKMNEVEVADNTEFKVALKHLLQKHATNLKRGDDDTEFKLTLKHLLDKHVVKGGEKKAD